SDHPDHLQKDKLMTPANHERDYQDFYKHKPEPARQQKYADLLLRLYFLRVQTDADTGEEYKVRCAEMGDKPCKEKRRRSLCQVGWIVRGDAIEVAHMVDGHDHHNDAT